MRGKTNRIMNIVKFKAESTGEQTKTVGRGRKSIRLLNNYTYDAKGTNHYILKFKPHITSHSMVKCLLSNCKSFRNNYSFILSRAYPFSLISVGFYI